MRKRFLCLCAALALLGAGLPVMAEEAATTTAIGTIVVVNGDSARVRAGASQNAEQIGVVNSGEQYDCLGVAANGWFQIAYPTGQTGYISNKLAALREGELSGSTFSYPIGTVRIHSEGDVRTRKGGGTAYAFMGSVSAGASYPCVGVSETGWYAIVQDKGWVVYVSSEYATLEATGEVVANQIPQSAVLSDREPIGIATITSGAAVNVREGGGENFRVITQVQPGETYLTIGTYDRAGWIGILLADAQVGYIAPNMAEVVHKKL